MDVICKSDYLQLLFASYSFHKHDESEICDNPVLSNSSNFMIYSLSGKLIKPISQIKTYQFKLKYITTKRQTCKKAYLFFCHKKSFIDIVQTKNSTGAERQESNNYARRNNRYDFVELKKEIKSIDNNKNYKKNLKKNYKKLGKN